MDSELSKPLSKNDLALFEKLKIKWKELSVEVNKNCFEFFSGLWIVFRTKNKDIILDGLYLNCTRLVKEFFDKNLKIELKQNKINEIGLKSVIQLLADKDLRGAEILLNHMVRGLLPFFCLN